jgi:signal transduction histidine kinase
LLKLRSIQMRFFLSFLLLIVLLLALSGIFVNNILRAYLRQYEADELTRRAQVVAAMVMDKNLFGNLDSLKAVRSQLERTAGVKITIIEDEAELLRMLPGYPNSARIREANPYRMVVSFTRFGRITAVVVIDPTVGFNPAVRTVNIALLRLGVLSLLAAVGLSVWLSRYISRPVQQLTTATTELGAGNWAHKIPVGRDDELGVLARNFNQMSEQLQASFRAVSRERDRLKDFVAEMSHELRTPLTALSTFNELLLDGADADPAARREFLLNAGQQIRRMQQLTENLLQLSRLDAGLLPLEIVPADLREVVGEAVERLEATAAIKGVTIDCRLPAEPVKAHCDASRLEQVIDNLAGNAIKYSPPGSTVRLALAEQDGWGRLTVSDEGPGIAEEDVPKLFQRFYRGKNQAADEPGSGLGLAVVRAIVEAHGGTVAVTNPARAEFTVTLPLAGRRETAER